jgi:hypothetical protein
LAAVSDIDGHMAVLASLNRELTESGEFVATQGLAAPHAAKFVRGLTDYRTRFYVEVRTVPLY